MNREESGRRGGGKAAGPGSERPSSPQGRDGGIGGCQWQRLDFNP